MTGLVDSSPVTAVIVVGFISAGLLSMPQSVGVIMGASIGSMVMARAHGDARGRTGTLGRARGRGLKPVAQDRDQW